MSSIAQRTGWNDLPVELIERVVIFLDPHSLLNLGRVNRVSNRVALARVLGPRSTREILSSSSINVPRFSPTELMPAISSALWLPPISHIDYAPIRHDIRTFMDDLHCLIRLISPSPANSLETIRLRFLLFDRKEIDRCLKELRHPSVSLRVWLSLMSELMDTALYGGCKSLDIGGSLFPYLCITGRTPRLVATIAHILQDAIRRIPRLNDASTTRSVRLESLTIGVYELLRPPFLHHTLGVFKRASQTLQRLEFCFTWPAITSRQWRTLFVSLSLPLLRTLVLTGGGYFPLPPKALLTFLTRHPNITDLELKFAFSVDSNTTRLTRPILPNLRTLQAWPHVVAWLLSPPPSIKLRKGGHGWYPSLLSVTILPNIRLSTPGDLLAVTRAILSLNHIIYPPTGTLSSRPAHLILRMSLFQSCWIRWIEETADNPAASVGGYDLTESRIKTMTLSLDHAIHHDIIQSPDLPTHLARWFGLFSRLEALEINPCPFTNNTANERLRAEILQRCHSLQMLKFPIYS